MQANTTEGQESFPHDRSTVSEIVTDFVEAVDAPESVAEPFVGLVEGMASKLEETAHDAAQARERAREAEARVEELEDELDETQEHSGQERAEISRRVSELEEADSPNATPTPEASRTTRQRDDLTPIEQLSQPTDVSEVTDSPTVERAVSLFSNLTDWGSKTPKGIVLKPADNPLSLLEADRDESLAWKQYYRAAEALEELSQGAVTFFDSDRHGKMLVLHEQSEAYSRIVESSLSRSSEGRTA